MREGMDGRMAVAREQGGPAQDGTKGRPRILIVDDDDDFCASTTALLEAEGYAVSRARSGKEALAKVSTEAPPDLIVLDIMMEHNWAGYEVNQAFKFGGIFPEAGHVPIVMVSSIRIDPAERFRWAGEVGMLTPDEYFTKPLDIPRFLSTVKSLLRRSP
jgi:two-component system, OmpR family, phosphate regulon response regulator PhoB